MGEMRAEAGTRRHGMNVSVNRAEWALDKAKWMGIYWG